MARKTLFGTTIKVSNLLQQGGKQLNSTLNVTRTNEDLQPGRWLRNLKDGKFLRGDIKGRDNFC